MTRHNVEIDDRILSYLEAGAGELVVLVHAFPLCAAMMAEAAPPVAIATALECLMTRPDSTPALAAFRGPALIIRGAQDALMPAADAERMPALIPGAASIEIPSSGHLPNWEQPEAFNRAWHSFLASRL